jgi:hypothetical protein
VQCSIPVIELLQYFRGFGASRCEDSQKASEVGYVDTMQLSFWMFPKPVKVTVSMIKTCPKRNTVKT